MIYPDPEDERDVYVPSSLTTTLTTANSRAGIESSPFDDPQFMELLTNLQQSNGTAGTGFNAGMSGPNELPNFSSFSNFDSAFQNDPLLAGLLANAGGAPQKQPESQFKKFLKLKVHIALLSIFTYLLINMAPFSCNVFLIFLLWEIVEIFILRQHETNPNSFMNIVFMLVGVSPAKVNVLIKWFQLINKVLRDVAIFLFFFILSHISYVAIYGKKLIPMETVNSSNMVNVDSVADHDGDIFDDPFDLK